MIDANLPVRFVSEGYLPDHGRVRIVGHDGMGHYRIRYHVGSGWRTTRVDENGWPVDVSDLPPIENYEIDWTMPIAFIDNGERAEVLHQDGETVVVTNDSDGRYLFTPAGTAMRRDGDFEIHARPIFQTPLSSTQQAERRRVEMEREAWHQAELSRIAEEASRAAAEQRAREQAQELMEANPLFGLF